MNISLQKYCLLAAYCIQSFLSAAVQAHGLDMDGSNGNDVSVLLSVEVVEVRSVLEVVCDAGTVLDNGVGDNVIVVGLDVKGNVLLGEDLLCDLKDLCWRFQNICILQE